MAPKVKKGAEICPQCKKKCTTNCIECSQCKTWLHRDCSGLSIDLFKNLDAEIKNLKYFCTSCEQIYAEGQPHKDIPTLLKMLSDMYYENRNLVCEKLKIQMEMDALKKEKDTSTTMDSIQKAHGPIPTIPANNVDESLQDVSQIDTTISKIAVPPPQVTDYIVIKPKDKTEHFIEDLARKVNPVQMKAKVTKLKKKKNGDVMIQCSDPKSTERLKNKIEEHYGNTVDVEENVTKSKIEFFIPHTNKAENLPTDLPTLTRQLIHQNDIDVNVPKNSFQVLAQRNLHKGTLIIVLVDNTTKLFIEKQRGGKLAWSFGMFPVKKHINITICYKCQGYGHKAFQCKQINSYCKYCADTHPSAQCKSDDLYCIQCLTRNHKYNQNLDYEHQAHTKPCPIFREAWERESNRQA